MLFKHLFFLNSTKKAVITISWGEMIGILLICFLVIFFKWFFRQFRKLFKYVGRLIRDHKRPVSEPFVREAKKKSSEIVSKLESDVSTVPDKEPTIVSLSCDNCGANLEIQLDHLLAYCPYCGYKLVLDAGRLGELLTEREKTKRESEKTIRQRQQQEYELEKRRMEIEASERKERRKWIGYAIYGGLGLLAFLIIAILGFLGY